MLMRGFIPREQYIFHNINHTIHHNFCHYIRGVNKSPPPPLSIQR